MPEMKRNYKDSVFTYLFSDKKYLRELYLYLHPEDTDVTEDEFQIVTVENIIAVGQYNDLGIQVRDRLILLVEAQSIFTINIVLRMLLYWPQHTKNLWRHMNSPCIPQNRSLFRQQSCMWSILEQRKTSLRHYTCLIYAAEKAV